MFPIIHPPRRRRKVIPFPHTPIATGKNQTLEKEKRSAEITVSAKKISRERMGNCSANSLMNSTATANESLNSAETQKSPMTRTMSVTAQMFRFVMKVLLSHVAKNADALLDGRVREEELVEPAHLFYRLLVGGVEPSE